MNFEISEEDFGKRLDIFLQEKLSDFSRSHIQNSIKSEESYILRNGKKLTKSGELLKLGDKVFCVVNPPKQVQIKPEKVDFEIIYQDEDVAVINKPQGVVVHPCASCPDGTLVNGLLNEISDLSGINGELRPGIVHRIDKDTCGLLLIAKNDKAHVELSKQIEKKTCSRKYLGLIEGTLKEQEGTVETLIGRDNKDRKKMKAFPLSDLGKNLKLAITNYRTVEYFKNYSLIEFSLKTGRTHQIRVHSKYLNHPLVGDETYGGAKKFGLKGQFLCAYKIKFVHPTTKNEMEFEIALPENFSKILENLRK